MLLYLISTSKRANYSQDIASRHHGEIPLTLPSLDAWIRCSLSHLRHTLALHRDAAEVEKCDFQGEAVYAIFPLGFRAEVLELSRRLIEGRVG